MAFKMKSGSPFQRNFGVGKSPAKGLVRGIGPHNPAHKAVGDDSNAAHELEEFKKLDPPKPKRKSIFDKTVDEETVPTVDEETGEGSALPQFEEGDYYDTRTAQKKDDDDSPAPMKSPMKDTQYFTASDMGPKGNMNKVVNHNEKHTRNPEWGENHDGKITNKSDIKKSANKMKSPAKQLKPKFDPSINLPDTPPVIASESTAVSQPTIRKSQIATAMEENKNTIDSFKESNSDLYDKWVKEFESTQGKEYDFDLGTGKEGGHSGMSRGTYENEPFPIPAWMGGEHLGKWTTSGQAKMRRDKAGALNDFILKKISDKGTLEEQLTEWDALTSRDDERYGD